MKFLKFVVVIASILSCALDNSQAGILKNATLNNAAEMDNTNDVPKVVMNFNQGDCSILCNGEYKIIDYNQESNYPRFNVNNYYEINDFVGNYFNIDFINYNNINNVLKVDFSYIYNNIPCILTIKNKFKNEPLPVIEFEDGLNQFFGISTLKFDHMGICNNSFPVGTLKFLQNSPE